MACGSDGAERAGLDLASQLAERAGGEGGRAGASLAAAWFPAAARLMLDGMDTEKNTLAIIVGSVRDGRFGPTVASWVADRAREWSARPEHQAGADRELPPRQSRILRGRAWR